MGLPSGTFNVNYDKDMAIARTKWQWGMLIGFLIFLASFPLFASSYILTVLITICITVIAVQGLNILTGYCGQLSLGQAGFLAVGAYSSAILATKFGAPFLVALIAAAIITALVGALFGIPAVRVKGFYLVMSTLAAHFIIIYLIMSLTKLTGGSDGLRVAPPVIGGFVFNTPERFYLLALAITAILVWFAKNIVRTRVGRAFIAIRDNDLAAEIMGVNLFRYKVVAFLICSFYAGIAGCLLTFYHQIAHPQFFTLLQSIWYIGMLIIGGLGSILGAILGAISIVLLGELVVVLSPIIGGLVPGIAGQISASLMLIVYALVIGLFLIFEPRGLAHRWGLFKASYRLWPFSYGFG